VKQQILNLIDERIRRSQRSIQAAYEVRDRGFASLLEVEKRTLVELRVAIEKLEDPARRSLVGYPADYPDFWS
jgi:hypothetical protein